MPTTFKTLAIALLMTSISAVVASNIARSDVLWNAALEVVDASLCEEICGQNVLPFVLPFNVTIGKL